MGTPRQNPPRARGRRLAPGCALGAALLAGLGAMPAHAQQTNDFLDSDIPFDLHHTQGVAVTERPHPELEPVGVRVGTSWLLLPAISTGLGYTDNVYGAASGKVGDGFVTVTPQALMVSEWSRHFLEFSADAAIKRFFQQTVRSETAYAMQADGRYDLGTGDSNITALAHYERGFEAQYEGDFPQNAAGTVEFHQADGYVRGHFVFNRVRLTVNEKVVDLRYRDTTSLAGFPIVQTYRDRTEYHSAARIEYSFNTDSAAFTEVSYDTADYHHATATQPLRSNHQERVLMGLNFDLHHIVRAMVGVGYERRSYDQSDFYPAISGVTFDASVQWLVTELTTINLEGSRKIEDAITASSPGYVADVAQIHIDHELLRYVQLFVESTYEHDSYAALTRRDSQVQARAGAIYAIGRHFKLRPSVWYIDRTSKGLPLGQQFNEVRCTVELFTQW